MTLKFVDGVEALHNKYLTGCNFSYLQDFELLGVGGGQKKVTVFLLILHLRHIQHFLAYWNWNSC